MGYVRGLAVGAEARDSMVHGPGVTGPLKVGQWAGSLRSMTGDDER